jgi:hypothetical protein
MAKCFAERRFRAYACRCQAQFCDRYFGARRSRPRERDARRRSIDRKQGRAGGEFGCFVAAYHVGPSVARLPSPYRGDHAGRSGRDHRARGRRDGRRLGLWHEVARSARSPAACCQIALDAHGKVYRLHATYAREHSLQVSAAAVRDPRVSVAIGSTIGQRWRYRRLPTCAPKGEQSAPLIAACEGRTLRAARQRTRHGPRARGTPVLPCSAKAHDSHRLSNRPHGYCRAH